MTTIPRIDRKLSEVVAGQVQALIVAYGPRFGDEAVTDCCALFLDALVPAEPGGALRVHRFNTRRAMELARGCIIETAQNGGDLAATAAGALFVVARRGEGQ